MEFKQLEMFVAVAEERSVVRAAAKVFRTQPAVSMAVQKLEQEFGSCLFDRTSRFELTAAGKLLWDYAKQMLALRDEASQLVAERVAQCSQTHTSMS
jgi:DNA-binding transcriptional LysR family regulator